MPDEVTELGPEWRYRDGLSCGHSQVTSMSVPFDRIGAWKREPDLYWVQCFKCRDEGREPPSTIVQIVDMTPMEPPFDE